MAQDQQLLREFIQRQEDWNEKQSELMEKIVRGLYGDEDNHAPGVFEQIKEHKKEIEKNTKFRQRLYWVGAGVVMTFEAIFHTLKDWFTNK